MSILYKDSSGNVNSIIPDMNNIDDSASSASTTYSSDKINVLLGGKVDKVEGKGLSTNDYTNADKSTVGNSPIADTTTGINPSITNSADGLIQDLTVYGESRVSKNLCPPLSQVTNYGISTFNIAAGEYVLRAKAKNKNLAYYINDINGNPIISTQSLNANSSASYIFTITESITIQVAFRYNPSESSFDLNDVYNVQIYTRSDDAESSVFEPYGIISIGDSGSLTITTENSDSSESSTATLITGLPLCGIPVTTGETYTDGDGQKWLADTASVEGVVKRCYKITFDGSENWSEYAQSAIDAYGNHSFMLLFSDAPKARGYTSSQIPNQLCNILTIASQNTIYNGNVNTIGLVGASDNQNFVQIRQQSCSTVAELKTYLASNPVTVVYELAEPYEIPLTSAELSALRNLRTYASTTNVTVTDEPTVDVGYLLDTDNGQAVADLENRIKSEIDEVKNENERSHFCYSYKIDMSDSNPATCVKPHFDPRYGCDNFNFTSAHMDYANDKFDYGSWEGFIRRIARPCMLKYDGTVDYYLDPDDYSKKITGEASDVADMNYQGNAMVELEKLYFKRYIYNGIQYCFIADRKLDKSFKAYAHHDKYGRELDYIYRACYDGSYDGTRLRSISGVDYHNLNALTAGYIMSNTTRQEEMNFAKANNVSTERGEGWNILHKAEWDYINDILVLIGMSTDTQTTFGRGRDGGYVSTSDTGIISTGTMDTKGLFWGKNDSTAGVKVLGFENPWANIWKSCAGWMMISNQHYTKMTFGTEDGSTGTGFNTDGTGYLATGASISANGYISGWVENDNGFLPTAASGSASTYRCDHVWQNTATYFALVGGDSYDGLRCGAFCAALHFGAGARGWDIGAALSYKPLAGGELAA